MPFPQEHGRQPGHPEYFLEPLALGKEGKVYIEAAAPQGLHISLPLADDHFRIGKGGLCLRP